MPATVAPVCVYVPDMSSYIRSVMHVCIPAFAMFCLNETIYSSVSTVVCMQICSYH